MFNCEIILFHHFFLFSFQDPVPPAPPAVPDAPATAPAKKGKVRKRAAVEEGYEGGQTFLKRVHPLCPYCTLYYSPKLHRCRVFEGPLWLSRVFFGPLIL